MADEDVLCSKTISFLRFPLTVGVVFIHFNIAEGFLVHGVKYGLNNPDWYYHIIIFFSDVLPRIGMPLFFIISGFLFFYRKGFNENVYKQKLKSRTITLLLPFFLWNSLAIFIKVLKNLYSNTYNLILSPERLFHTYFTNFEDQGIFVKSAVNETTLTAISKIPFPIDLPLWYVRDLMVMIIIAPVVFSLIRKLGYWCIIILGLLWYFRILVFEGYPILLFQATFFFSCGAYFSIKEINVCKILCRTEITKFIPILYILIAMVDTFTKNTDYNFAIHQIGILLGIISVVVISTYLVERGVKINTTLTNCSFFVFALHYLIMPSIGILLFTLLDLSDNTYSLLFLFFICPTITIVICVLLYIILRRYLPASLSMLTGGRI